MRFNLIKNLRASSFITVIFIGFIAITACSEKDQAIQELPEDLYPQPTKVKLNTEDGYLLNPVTKDSVQVLINYIGDTVETGQKFPETFEQWSLDTFPTPEDITKYLTIDSFPIFPNVHKVPSKLKTVEIDLSNCSVNSINEEHSTERVTKIFGKRDTIVTGIPVKSTGVKKLAGRPRAVYASKPSSTNNSPYDMQFLKGEHGLVGSYIKDILQDKKGNIWMGTGLSGVIVYNGTTFQQYTKNEGLIGSNIVSLFEDSKGNIWIGTKSGISKFDGESFTNYNENNGFTSSFIQTIHEDKNGNIWVGTQGSGLIKFDGEFFTHYTKKEGLRNLYVWTIDEDSKGNIWLGTSHGLSKFDGNSFTNITPEDGLNDNFVLSLYIDKKDILWMGTWRKGLNKFDGKTLTNYSTSEGIINDQISDITVDKDKNLWIATNKGISKFDGEKFTNFSKKEGLESQTLNTILVDHLGKIWMGSKGYGLNIYNPKSFIHFSNIDGLKGDIVRSIREDSMKNIWLQLDPLENRVFFAKISGETLTTYSIDKTVKVYTNMCSLFDSKGRLWMGSGDGLLIYDGKKLMKYLPKNGIAHPAIRNLYEDSKGNIWIAYQTAGVTKFDGKTFKYYSVVQGLTSNTAMAITEDRKGNVFIATYFGGIIKYDGANFTNITDKEGLSHNDAYTIKKDHYGNVWVGTAEAGVVCFDGENFIPITEKEGFGSISARSIEEDHLGNIWITSDQGIQKINLNGKSFTESKNIKLKSFGQEDGLMSTKFFENGSYFDSKNRLWFASVEGLEMLDLNKIDSAVNTPKIFLSELKINAQIIDFKSLKQQDQLGFQFDSAEPFYNYPNNLKLDYKHNHLTFYYYALDWNAPTKLKYSYRLKGLNNEWSVPSSETKADFTNIPYGTYIFEVRAIGFDSVWSEPFIYEFTITPPWWHTWWGRTLYIALILLMFYGVIRWRTYKLKQKQIDLELKIEDATLEIRSQKEQVEEAHKEIKDSINYAERIQRSFLATDDQLKSHFNEFFIFFRPKEVVSGDFYWAGDVANGQFAFVNADSTGHGVPGAIMSILNISSIEKAVEKKLSKPADIFNFTRESIIERLKKDGSVEGGKDGMDATILCFDFGNNKFSYTAANNPIWIVRKGELIELKPEKMPVGKHDKDSIPFVGGEFEIQKGDMIYTLTDGFQDQFGGENIAIGKAGGKKFKMRPLKNLMIAIAHLSVSQQEALLASTFDNWKGDLEQIDDVCIVGIKV